MAAAEAMKKLKDDLAAAFAHLRELEQCLSNEDYRQLLLGACSCNIRAANSSLHFLERVEDDVAQFKRGAQPMEIVES